MIKTDLSCCGCRSASRQLRNGPEVLAHKVVEVGSDFVVIEDIAGIQQLRIPVYSIKSIGITKIGKAQ